MDLQVDALYFQARESRAPYAIVETKVKHPGFKSHLGVRASVGTDIKCDCWKVWLQYLHYHARARDQIKGQIIPTWGYRYSVLSDFVSFVDSMWRLHMGLADLSLGRIWNISECLDLLTFCSLRYSEIRHKIELNYGNQLRLSMKNKTFGFGPLFGVEAYFWLWKCFGFFSKITADLLYTKVYIHSAQDGARGKLNTLEKYWQIFPQFDAAVGLDSRWNRFYGRLAGEIYFFPNQNQLNDRGDLVLYGLVFGAGLYF